MKNGFFLFLFICLIASPALPQTPAVKPKKTPAPKTATKKTPTRTKAVKASPSKKGRSSRKSTKTSTAFRPRQLTPTPDRYREIQQALADKGYLKAEPDGVWDARSVDALRQFQTDRNLSPTGKISSASLIGLGLGPNTAPMPPAGATPADVSPPPPPTSQ